MKNQYISKVLKPLSLCAVVMLFGCKQDQKKEDVAMSDNILLQEWTGPYQGVPAFDKMSVADVKPAMETAMELSLAEIDNIANNPEAPTFENTIVEMERSGKVLDRVFTYYGIMSSNVSSPEFREVQTELAPKISEYSSKISQNEKLFQRIKTVYDASQENPLEPDQQRVVDLTYKRFEMNGANLDSTKKERYAAINKELSTLYTKFANNFLRHAIHYLQTLCIVLKVLC